MDLPDAYKKTVLIDALPDCMETDRAALERMSATLTLRSLKAEVSIAVDQYLRRNSPDMESGTSGSSTQGSTPVQALSADHQRAVDDSNRLRHELTATRSSLEVEG